MLLYKNHRFHCEGVSFAIPDGYCLDTSYEEVPEDTMHLWSEDESLYIRIGIERETCGPWQELTFVLCELEECIVIQRPSTVILGGLAGYSATYSVGDKQYWETRLGISGEGDKQIELLILIAARDKLPTFPVLEELIRQIDPKYCNR